jgi:hypothetical protein
MNDIFDFADGFDCPAAACQLIEQGSDSIVLVLQLPLNIFIENILFLQLPVEVANCPVIFLAAVLKLRFKRLPVLVVVDQVGCKLLIDGFVAGDRLLGTAEFESNFPCLFVECTSSCNSLSSCHG